MGLFLGKMQFPDKIRYADMPHLRRTTLEAAREIIYGESINAEAAWQRQTAELAAAYAGMEDEYMQARAADIEDVGRRVLRHLMGVDPPSLDFAEPSILIAADLSPSDTARLSPERVLAICTEMGGATGHSAILAKALGIPAVVGLGLGIWQIAEGQQVAVDGEAGLLWQQPEPLADAEVRPGVAVNVAFFVSFGFKEGVSVPAGVDEEDVAIANLGLAFEPSPDREAETFPPQARLASVRSG